MRPLLCYAFFALLIVLMVSSAHAQPFEQALQLGGADTDRASGVAVDASGGWYVTGQYAASATFGEGSDVVTLTLPSGTPTFEGYLAFYEADGRLAWVTPFRSAPSAPFGSTGVDVVGYPDGGALVTGTFHGTTTFGEGLDAVTLTASGSNADVFLARYDAVGTLRWAQKVGSSLRDIAVALAVNAEGLGLISLELGSADVLRVYGADGVFRRALSLPAPAYDVALGLDGTVYATGQFFGNATFGTGGDAITLTNRGNGDGFVVAYAPNQVPRWATSFGGSSFYGDQGTSLALGPDGTLCASGSFANFLGGPVTFGEGDNAVTLSGLGAFNGFAARYQTNGQLDWAEAILSASAEVRDITVDPSGRCILAGQFGGTATFGEGPDAMTITSSRTQSAFIATYRPDGLVQQVIADGDVSGNILNLNALALSSDGTQVIAGQFGNQFGGDLMFGEGADAVLFTTRGSTDGYVAQFGATSPPVTLTLTPDASPVDVAPGGSFSLTVALSNTTSQTRTVQVWSEATLPSGAFVGPLVGPVTVTLPAGASVQRTLVQQVPAAAPAGTYFYTGRVGTFATEVSALASFQLDVQPAARTAAASADVHDASVWPVTDAATGNVVGLESFQTEGVKPLAAAVRSGHSLAALYPNPATRSATLGFTLTEASTVRLAVYDVLGREVERLIDREVDAGSHRAVLDASTLPSGVYFVRLEARGHIETQRLIIVR